MTEFLLMRHGETAWHFPNSKGAKGWGADLAPLTENGISQIKNAIPTIQSWAPELLLTSPTTRTLTSCALITMALRIPFVVEFNLHEWIPDLSFNWKTSKEVEIAQNEMVSLGGEYPEGEIRSWEPLSTVRRRALDVFNNYLTNAKVAVVCHEWVIFSLTGRKLLFAESVDFKYGGSINYQG